MDFKENKSLYGTGKIIGFFTSYLVFTTILFFILSITKKLPLGWNYIYVATITLAVAIAGIILKRYLI